MLYRWDDYSLDREGTLLTRQGQQIDVSRKVLDCISHLVERRERVVGYDELIRKVWGHESVTNHQLSQVILAARRALGDDGQAQRLIRTMPGLGYRWVGEVIQSNRNEVPASVPTQYPASKSDAPVTVAPSIVPDVLSPVPEPGPATMIGAKAEPRSKAIALGILVFCLLCSGIYLLLSGRGGDSPTEASSTHADPMVALKDALRTGNFEEVREGLASLPPHLADAPDARILEIELDLYRGRLSNGLEKLEKQLSRPEPAADPVLHAKLFILKGQLISRMGKTPVEILALAESTLELLDSVENGVSSEIRAVALERRASALLMSDRPDDALRDLALANDLYKLSGDVRRAIDVKSSIARVWMRMGRLQDALNESREAAEAYRRTGDRVSEIFAYNTITRIQMELLRWDDAIASNDRSMRLLREMPDVDRRHRSLQLRAQALSAKGQLRLAASQLEEAEGLRFESGGFIIPAFHLLESGDVAGALESAQKGFETTSAGDRTDILLDSKDGALLLWITAAQRLAETGIAMPTPSPEKQQYLQNPKTSLGRIASGRWLWSQGKRHEAETELRRALDESRRMNHLFRMTLAAEPLVEMLLQDGDIKAAQVVATDLRAFDPERMDGDYRACLLRLRIALAAGNKADVSAFYRKTIAVGGERRISPQVLTAYRKLIQHQGRPSELANDSRRFIVDFPSQR